MRPDEVLTASAGGFLRSTGGGICSVLGRCGARPEPEPAVVVVARPDCFFSSERWHAPRTVIDVTRMRVRRIAAGTYGSTCARASRRIDQLSAVPERLAGEVPDPARLDHDVVL